MRGRKPKPIALRVLEGNPGKRPLVKRPLQNIPKSGVMGFSTKMQGGRDSDTPKCPGWLSKEAKREWHRVTPILKRLKLLNALDRTALIGYCQSYARYVEAEKVVEKHGILLETENGYMMSPRVAVAQKYLQIALRICVEFGMTPSSKARMPFGGGGEEEKDEFEKILD